MKPFTKRELVVMIGDISKDILSLCGKLNALIAAVITCDIVDDLTDEEKDEIAAVAVENMRRANESNL